MTKKNVGSIEQFMKHVDKKPVEVAPVKEVKAPLSVAERLKMLANSAEGTMAKEPQTHPDDIDLSMATNTMNELLNDKTDISIDEAREIYVGGNQEMLGTDDMAEIHAGGMRAVEDMGEFEKMYIMEPAAAKGYKVNQDLSVDKREDEPVKVEKEKEEEINDDLALKKLEVLKIPDVKSDAPKIRKMLEGTTIIRKRTPATLKRIKEKRIKSAKNHTIYLPNSAFSVTAYAMNNRLQRMGYIEAFSDDVSGVNLYAQLYKRMLVEQDGVMAFEEFLEKFSLLDEPLLQFAFLVASAKDEMEFDITCGNSECVVRRETNDGSLGKPVLDENGKTVRNKYQITVPTLDLIHISDEEKYNDLEAEYFDVDTPNPRSRVGDILEIPLGQDYVVTLKHASLKDLLTTKDMSEDIIKHMKDFDFAIDPEKMALLTFIDSILEVINLGDDDHEPEAIVYEDKREIYEALYFMDDEYLEMMNDRIDELASDILVDINIKNATCPYCGKEAERIVINPSDMVFINISQKMRR
jgi:hypothetical protein